VELFERQENLFALIVIALLAIVYFGLQRRLNDSTKPEKVPRRLLTTILRGGILLVLALVLGIIYHVPITGLVTGLAAVLATFAIGFFAVWSVLSNSLCTLVLLILRPYAVGDKVSIPFVQVEGVVSDIDFVFTTLRTAKNVYVKVPNNLFFQHSMEIEVS